MHVYDGCLHKYLDQIKNIHIRTWRSYTHTYQHTTRLQTPGANVGIRFKTLHRLVLFLDMVLLRLKYLPDFDDNESLWPFFIESFLNYEKKTMETIAPFMVDGAKHHQLSFPSWSLMTSVRNEGWTPKFPMPFRENRISKASHFTLCDTKYTKNSKKILRKWSWTQFHQKKLRTEHLKMILFKEISVFSRWSELLFVGNDETSQPVRLRSLSYRTVSKKEKQDCFEGSWCVFSLPKKI